MTAIASSVGSQDIRMDYLNLLVAQLRNQDPLEPLDNNQMASQLTQLSQLEQLENQSQQLAAINATFQQALLGAQRNQAAAMIGKEVTFDSPQADGTTTTESGRVEGVEIADGQVWLRVGDYGVSLDAIRTISN